MYEITEPGPAALRDAVIAPWYAVKRRVPDDVASWAGNPGEYKYRAYTWLEDPRTGQCSIEFGRSIWFDTVEEVLAALSPELLAECSLVECRINPEGGNHYITRDVPWP